MATKKELCSLKTHFEKGAGWEEYPRPQMKRESYYSLAGKWELFVKKGDLEERLPEITVPFAPESALSGVFREKKKGERYLYKKSFFVGREMLFGRVLLHFGAVDQIAEVFVNDKKAGEHVGGYLPFSFDITELLKEGENCICVLVTDELFSRLAIGKQRKKRGGMWYTPISGIWQTVWLEAVPHEYIRSIRLTPTLESIRIETEGGKREKTLTVFFEDGAREYSYEGDSIEIRLESPHLWTPEDPYLYCFALTDGIDRIESYFALRTVGIKKSGELYYITLNERPYFFHGLLDQGYYPDGIYTPSSPEGYRWDILKMKELGFNMLRKHIKTEPELFYYYCDKYGMIVFQDMVNSGRYNFLIDTALPTVGLRRGVSHRATRNRREHFEGDMRELTALLYNHPSVCYYTIFNEGWGQYDADRLYREMKAEDPSRIWDATSGWFFEKESDVKSEHIYFKRLDLRADKKRPLVLSEFGGYSLRVDGHLFNPHKNYGYKSFSSKKELTEGLYSLYASQVIPEIEKNGLCCTVLTQLSDVEDETNGMVTYDRQEVKAEEAVMREISKRLREAFLKKTKQ